MTGPISGILDEFAAFGSLSEGILSPRYKNSKHWLNLLNVGILSEVSLLVYYVRYSVTLLQYCSVVYEEPCGFHYHFVFLSIVKGLVQRKHAAFRSLQLIALQIFFSSHLPSTSSFSFRRLPCASVLFSLCVNFCQSSVDFPPVLPYASTPYIVAYGRLAEVLRKTGGSTCSKLIL